MVRPDTDNLYLQRVNAVIDHIYGALDDDLSLETLAGVAVSIASTKLGRICNIARANCRE
jgi:hypothetical protein